MERNMVDFAITWEYKAIRQNTSVLSIQNIK